MEPHPTKIELTDDDGVMFEWSDAQRQVYTFRQLRDACPCATCRETRQQPKPAASDPLAVISTVEAQPLKILEIKPVGRYAYTIRFSDGHDTGIYPFAMLRELGSQPQ